MQDLPLEQGTDNPELSPPPPPSYEVLIDFIQLHG